MDHFREEIVVKKSRGLDEALYYLSVFVMVVMTMNFHDT